MRQMNIVYITIASLQPFIFFVGLHKGLRLIWPYIQYSNDISFYITSMMATQIIIQLCGNLYYYLFYHLEHPYFEQYKVEKKPWPWQESKDKWNMILKETCKYFALNFVLGWTLDAIHIYYSGTITRMNYETYPSLLEVLWQTFFCYLNEDFFFYWIHRLLHQPKLYELIHKQHHQYNITGVYDYNFSIDRSLVCTSNRIYIWKWRSIDGRTHYFGQKNASLNPDDMVQPINNSRVSLRLFKTMNAHSGYMFPWEIFSILPLGQTSDFHSFHHSKNVGNYGSQLMIWDRLFKTDKYYEDWKKLNQKKKS